MIINKKTVSTVGKITTIETVISLILNKLHSTPTIHWRWVCAENLPLRSIQRQGALPPQTPPRPTTFTYLPNWQIPGPAGRLMAPYYTSYQPLHEATGGHGFSAHTRLQVLHPIKRVLLSSQELEREEQLSAKMLLLLHQLEWEEQKPAKMEQGNYGGCRGVYAPRPRTKKGSQTAAVNFVAGVGHDPTTSGL